VGSGTIRKFTKIYPYETGGVGTSIAEFLSGKARLGRITPPPETVFHEGSGKVMNTIPPNDFSYYEMLNEVVQQEPATALDPELMGPIAAIGIVKGKPFAPDERMRKILTEAAAVGNATSRSLFMAPRAADWYYYPGSAWSNFLFVSGYQFETPIPMITPEGVKPFPATGYRTLDARSAFFYGITGITPAMAMRLPGIGSQYLLAFQDANKQFFDGAKTVLRRREDLQGDAAQGHPRGEVLVPDALRQPDALDAGYAAAPSTRRQPEVPVARRRGGRVGRHDGVLRPQAARGRQAGQLDPDGARQGLVRDPAALQPARAVLRQELAAERDRAGSMSPPADQRWQSTPASGRP
jgi:hypothetical protein